MLDKILNLILIFLLIAFNIGMLYLGYYYDNLTLAIILALFGTISSVVFWRC